MDLWLDTVSYAKSGSHNTERNYRRNFQKFLKFIGKTSEDILRDYEKTSDREFKRKYAQFLRAWIGNLNRKGHTNGSIKVMVSAFQSFCKYSDLPLGYVPTPKDFVVYENRDITKEEIKHLLAISRPRDRAFFSVMVQSGLRPYTICLLQLKHLHPDLYNGTVPCKIEVPREIAKGKYQGYFTFIGVEAVKHLKAYLKSRANLTPESFLFVRHGSEQQATPKSFTHKFERNIRKLLAKGIVHFNQKQKGKPGELRLYNLRKFFKKFANQAGSEFVRFWMGHKGKGVTDHYISRDSEFHRKLYGEKAMPFLRLEIATPTETEQTVIELRQRVKEVENFYKREMEKGIGSLQKQIEELRKVMEEEQKPRLPQPPKVVTKEIKEIFKDAGRKTRAR